MCEKFLEKICFELFFDLLAAIIDLHLDSIDHIAYPSDIFSFFRSWQTGVIRPDFIDEMNVKNSSAHSQLKEFDLGFHSICVTLQSVNI